MICVCLLFACFQCFLVCSGFRSEVFQSSIGTIGSFANKGRLSLVSPAESITETAVAASLEQKHQANSRILQTGNILKFFGLNNSFFFYRWAL